MAGLLSRLAAATGLPLVAIRVALIGLALLLVLLVLWAGQARYDRALIAREATRSAVASARADRAADASAATRRREDDARLEAEADALERITDHAIDAHAARRAYYDCIRLQQQARAAGTLTPACR